MPTYKTTLIHDAPDASAAAQKVTVALYLGDLDVDTMTIEEVNEDGTLFSYPLTKQLLEEKNNG